MVRVRVRVKVWVRVRVRVRVRASHATAGAPTHAATVPSYIHDRGSSGIQAVESRGAVHPW